MTARLILVRHGQTVANVAKRLDTRLPGAALTPEGLTQAEQFGRRVAEARTAAALVSSQALRARQTAGFAETASGLVLDVRVGLHEAQAGDLEDRSDEGSHELYMKTFQQWQMGEHDARLPGGESARDVFDRYLPVRGDLRAEYLEDPAATGDVVVVSHGAAIRLVAAHLAHVPGVFAASTHLANTESVELLPTADGGWECVRWGRALPPFEGRRVRGADDPMG
ncbi:histidine phosphatase family protein [Rhodococcus sp. HNM0569]|uniref:histidine phosphatase family protein n=1 Tax=Rhodococcus sp. HNM0569 TaxID=2716340 RepID=UPI00146A9D57|nr:histidine phosphatase family protein [Rhodococcus sp. HNM0569]NLU85054.1 histidine phosphatase family protein [Rhodococcus sp. HNM0569]